MRIGHSIRRTNTSILYDKVRIPEPGTFWDDYAHRASPARAARMRIEDMPDFNPPPDLTGRQRKQWNYQRFMEHFLGTLRSQDDNIGRLFEYLEKSGLAENTIVVYTTDHGFFLGDHGWFDKRFMYEQAIRVPWMIRCPGWKGKAACAATGSSISTMRLRCSIWCGLPIPPEMQGKSIVACSAGQSRRGGRPRILLPLLRIRLTALGRSALRNPHQSLQADQLLQPQ